ncbi:tRNA (adenosine(37)-N6)-threonylcarbamoyltransferase complex transferase subunit TsaD [Candidatus Nomurabacteria bacterium RIFCSPHIGHO2_01_FULL_39_9]|uniref:tRNA N6-adenosine threonylcarbamoyltransferase n=1 Tax=Candidatus Nomurabacteria bacterium RIFCSPHIGHO2_01_FULL_39_9 TaxID=1801735 RepID=A0A1F6UWM3_9BACT|nr:MAG: tRNA (adenosine(37)-N6)-threonylcarbamoyltransferase complex transferase subunit TsaD [Candidatus Nomurabacteria bacterium RIFCSPHIGHO2_01_FULL_39_9]
MKILAIETSCDETAISVLDIKGNLTKIEFKILANNLASQVKLHRKYGGVFPMLAKREHLKNLPLLLKKTLKEVKIKTSEIDLIAVTYGPGLEPALWTGITFAKELARAWKIKLLAVNHMEGHIFSSLIDLKEKYLKPVKFPALALLISGGHTELVLIKKWFDYKVIGETRDDAAGEAFDKVARLLGLPYPGGPEISKIAKLKTKIKYKLPRPMINSGDFDFSFSGLKTAVLYLTRDLGKLNKTMKIAIAKEFQDAVTDVLVSKTIKVARKYKIKTLLVGGGVAANERIRSSLKKEAEKEKITVYFPQKELSVDNGIMIGLAGYFRSKSKSKNPPVRTLKACGTLRLSK